MKERSYPVSGKALFVLHKSTTQTSTAVSMLARKPEKCLRNAGYSCHEESRMRRRKRGGQKIGLFALPLSYKETSFAKNREDAVN